MTYDTANQFIVVPDIDLTKNLSTWLKSKYIPRNYLWLCTPIYIIKYHDILRMINNLRLLT